ncbi:MAG: hypothetical protein L3J59_15310 [Methylococcaceae bacterium]|nr:hypothetical protein [Methylococcaceae bacterium]
MNILILLTTLTSSQLADIKIVADELRERKKIEAEYQYYSEKCHENNIVKRFRPSYDRSQSACKKAWELKERYGLY